MKKFLIISSLVLIVLLGSITAFYTTNMILSDVANNFYGFQEFNFVFSLGALMVALDFVLATLFIIRYYRRQKYFKNLVNLYSKILFYFSISGLVLTISGAYISYGTLISNYPFKAFTILTICFHLITLVFSVIANKILLKKIDGEIVKKKAKPGYVVYTTILSVLVFFSFNRFGALLLSPIFIQTRTLYLTYPFYLSLLLPFALLLHSTLYIFDFYKKAPSAGIIFASSIMIMNFVLAASIISTGVNNPVFISAISACLPIERLITKPVDITIQFVLVFLFSGYGIYYSIRFKNKHGNDYKVLDNNKN